MMGLSKVWRISPRCANLLVQSRVAELYNRCTSQQSLLNATGGKGPTTFALESINPIAVDGLYTQVERMGVVCKTILDQKKKHKLYHVVASVFSDERMKPKTG